MADRDTNHCEIDLSNACKYVLNGQITAKFY